MKLSPSTSRLKSVDLFCGAGGIADGFRQAGFDRLYGNDLDPEAIATFHLNHPHAFADKRPIEEIDVATVKRQLKVRKSE